MSKSCAAFQNKKNLVTKLCKKCLLLLPIEDFYRGTRDAQCRKCIQYRKKNHPNRSEVLFKSYLKRKYDITPQKWYDMLKQQEGKCAICGELPKINHRRFHVDHDHKTGKIRGLLCGPCNWLVGYSKESTRILSMAVVYLHQQGYPYGA